MTIRDIQAAAAVAPGGIAPRPFAQIGDARLDALDFVLTDIDDTLTTDGRLPAIAYAALETLQRAGLKVPVGMQGRDLFAAAAANLPVVVEDPGISVFADADARSAILSVVHDGWRLSLFEQAPGRGELYHFAEDPDEMANLWDASEASARKADLLEKLCLRQLSLRDMRLCPTARA